MVLARHLVERHTLLRQHSADPHLSAVSIRMPALVHNVLAKARTVVYAQDPPDRSGCGTHRTSDDGADRASRPVTSGGALFRATDGALGMRRQR